MGVLLDTFSLLPFGAGLLVMAGLVGLGELLGIVLSDTVPFFKKGIIAGILLSLFFIAGPLMASSINAQPMSQKHAKVSF